MSRGNRGGPRQPGGGRREAGPRQQQRGTRGAARFGGGGKRRSDERATSRRPDEGAAEFGHGVGRGKGPRPPMTNGKRKPFSRKTDVEGRAPFEHRRPAPAREEVRVAKPSPALAEATKVQTVTIAADEDGMRVDRFFEARFPGLSFSHIQRIIRKGEVRVDGKRTEPKARLTAGQTLRIPPLKLEAPPPRDDAPQAQQDRAFIKSITLYEDDDVMVLNKPMGLAVQGGSGTVRHVDGMLGALRGPGVDAQRPRLVHRLDKDTAGCLLVAKTRFAAAALAKTFRSRSARKIYWALVAGVPKPRQGRISTYLAKQEIEEDSFMRVAKHGDKDAVHAVTYYAVVETSAQKLAWISLKPVTGRTHQLRAHMAHVGNPIVGDPKYFNIENWELPGGIQNRLHLLARRIAVPHPRGGIIDVSAPLPPHMEQSWNLLGFDAKRYDPIEDAPEEE
jgi:23S rRNA pseudouridine955/2504/2580 synthase